MKKLEICYLLKVYVSKVESWDAGFALTKQEAIKWIQTLPEPIDGYYVEVPRRVAIVF